MSYIHTHTKISYIHKAMHTWESGMSDRHYKCRKFWTGSYLRNIPNLNKNRTIEIEHILDLNCRAPITIKKTTENLNPVWTDK